MATQRKVVRPEQGGPRDATQRSEFRGKAQLESRHQVQLSIAEIELGMEDLRDGHRRRNQIERSAHD